MTDPWIFEKEGYNPKDSITDGNAFFLGNGCFGCRGTPDEYTKEHMPGLNLGGVYDKRGEKWRETVNAPNPFFCRVYVDGQYYGLPQTAPERHKQSLDLKRGVSLRETVWRTPKGLLKLEVRRFLSMDQYRLGASRLHLTATYPCRARLEMGIDGDVYDCNGPHLEGLRFSQEEQALIARAATWEKALPVAVALYAAGQGSAEQGQGRLLYSTSVPLAPQAPYTVDRFCAVYAGKDWEDPARDALALVKTAAKTGYEELLCSHAARWRELYAHSWVELCGDDQAQQAMNYSLYHLHSIAPRHKRGMSIAARGLSGQTYKGAVFWDTEIFMLPFFLNTEPSVARGLLEYRILGLEGARRKAAQYGLKGAFFAWESQEMGWEACSDYNVTDVFSGRPQRTYFRDKQVHISGDVAYALWQYVQRTQDVSLLREGGMALLIECALFYLSRACATLGDGAVHLWDVLGPDEYHERVNDNAFTNRMGRFSLEIVDTAYQWLAREYPEAAAELWASYDLERLLPKLRAAAERFIPPARGGGGVIEQFDGYFSLEDCTVEQVRKRLLKQNEYWGGANGVAAHTQVIKQADVLSLMQLFPSEFTDGEVDAAWAYYEPRTEHGSSLSAAMYALGACRTGRLEKAYELFMSSARIDMMGGGKQFAGDIYIGGAHPAAAGGAWMTAVMGFGGLRATKEGISAKGRLPEKIRCLRFIVTHMGTGYRVTVTGDKTAIERQKDDHGWEPIQ